MKIAAAALIYFVIVFAAGFLLGTVRVLMLEPRIGPVAATLCEAPFLVLVMVVAARWVPRALQLRQEAGAMVLAGLGALALQQAAEFILGSTLRGLSAGEQLAKFSTPEGLIYLALLVIFASMPLLANRPFSS